MHIMKDKPEVMFWQRTDTAGLERLTLREVEDGVLVDSTVIGVEDGGFRIDHRWTISSEWQALAMEVEKWTAGEHARLKLERVEDGWSVDGVDRADLAGADEPDLSVTPFCNTLPIRRLMRENVESLAMDICFVDAASMTVARSRQRYDLARPGMVRYVDLGVSAGFEADLLVDRRGLVERYQGLFKRVFA